jgi:predicted RNA-binding Zn ribbon-like protein
MGSVRNGSAEEREGFIFRSDRRCLDFVGTLTGKRREGQRDRLARPSDLARWLLASELSPIPLRPTGRDLADARLLREAMYRLVQSKLSSRRYDPVDTRTVNRWARMNAFAPQLEATGIRWVNIGPDTCLAALARDCVELLGGPLADRLRTCAGDGCGVIFLDTSRSGKRRWCSMAACGNRAKVNAYRRREGTSPDRT